MKQLNNYINEALIKKDTKIESSYSSQYTLQRFINKIKNKTKFGPFYTIKNRPYDGSEQFYKSLQPKKCYEHISSNSKYYNYYFVLEQYTPGNLFDVINITHPGNKPDKITIEYKRIKVNLYGGKYGFGQEKRVYLFFNLRGNVITTFYVNYEFINNFIDLLNKLYNTSNKKERDKLIKDFDKNCKKNNLYLDTNEDNQ